MSQPSDPHGFDGPVEDFVGPVLRAGYEDLVRKMHESRRIIAPGASVEIKFDGDLMYLEVETIPAPETS